MNRLLALSCVTPALVWGSASPATALSCVSPEESMVDAAHVFVGDVVAAEDGHVQVRVSEVWKGPDLAELVWVDGEDDLSGWYAWNGPGSLEQTIASSEEWVVATDGAFATTVCWVWPAADTAVPYGTVRPEVPRRPVPAGRGSAATGAEPPEVSVAPVAAGLVGAAGVLGVGGFLLHRARRRSD